jgi:hypothetical protein
MKIKNLHIVTVLLCLLAALPLSAQQHRDRWNFEDYFPKNYFYDDKEFPDENDDVGEVVFYMRLADIKPLRDITLNKGETILRLNYIPKFAHPLFIQVQQKGDQILLTWQKGTALRGYVQHITHLAMSDTGYVDVTENYYHSNEWEKGVLDSGSRQLTLTEWQQIQEILTDIDFIHFPHCRPCGGFQTPYILEFKDNRNSISYYTECPDDEKEDLVTNLLISFVDTDYVDMVIHVANARNNIVAPTFPGGEEACAAFLQKLIQYPSDALRDMKEFNARVKLVVEKDGSILPVSDIYNSKSDYGFEDELIRVVKTMPKWNPATKNGKNIRCNAYVNYKFVLPEDIRPQYGSPILETQRDKRRWESIESYHRQLLLNPLDQEATLWLAKNYYSEYVFEHKEPEPLSAWDSTRYQEDDWANYHDRTAVVAQPGDSALKYFYKVLELNTDTLTITEIYMPILQLEQHLHRTHNPLAELPFDTVDGVHFPYSYLINWPEDGLLDSTKDYDLEAWLSFRWVKYLSEDLTRMQEPVIFNDTLQEDEAIFRFSFFPSFHPPVSFRIMKNKQKVKLYWKILSRKINPKNVRDFTYVLKKGHRRMTTAQYEQFLQYFEAVHLDKRPHSYYVAMLDGAQWMIERKTNQGFKGHFTNVAGKNIHRVYCFLAKLSGAKLDYMVKYL